MDVTHCKESNKKGKKNKGGSAKKDPKAGTLLNSFDPCKRQICDPKDPKHLKKECPEPFLCIDKLRFPDPTEKNEPCDTTPFVGAKDCPRNAKKTDKNTDKKGSASYKPKLKKPHPCDKKLSCSSQAYKNLLKQQKLCDGPALCYDRIKNPDDDDHMKKAEDCIP